MSDTSSNNEPPRESPADQFIKRFRSTEAARSTEKKRKLSTGILLINLVMLTIIYVFYIRGNKTDDYQTGAFTYRGVQFRFSHSMDRGTGHHYFSLTMKSSAPRAIAVSFPEGLGEIVIFHENDAILRIPIGKETRLLTLKPGETLMQRQTLGKDELKPLMDGHPGWVQPQQRSFFQFEKSHIPLKAEIVILDDRKMSIPLTFNYEVER